MTVHTKIVTVIGFGTVIKLMTVDDSDDSPEFRVKILVFELSSKLPKPAAAISFKSFAAVELVNFFPSTAIL